jgi:hypothetical protein
MASLITTASGLVTSMAAPDLAAEVFFGLDVVKAGMAGNKEPFSELRANDRPASVAQRYFWKRRANSL